MRPVAPYPLHLLRGGIYSMAHALVWTAMLVYQVQVIGMTPLQLVLAGTTMEITIFVFEIPTGVVADVFSRRLSTIIGYAMIGVSYMLQGLIPAFGAILAGNAIWGLGYTFTSGAYDAWLVDELGATQAGSAFVRGSQVERVTGVIGIVLAAVLGSIQLALPIVAGGALMVALAVLLALIMPETAFHPRPPGERASWKSFTGTFRDGFRLTRNQPVLLILLLIMLFHGLFSEGFDRLWQAHFLRTFALEAAIGLPAVVVFAALNILGQIVGVGLAEIARRRVDTSNRAAVNRILFLLTVLMIGGLVVFGLAPTLLIAFAAWLVFTQARELNDPFLRTWTNQHIPEDSSSVRATVLSMQSQAHAIGEVVGGPPVGAVGNASLRLAFLGSAALLSPVLVLLRRVRKLDQSLNHASVESIKSN